MGRKLMGRRGRSMEGGLLVILKDRLRVGRELGGGSWSNIDSCNQKVRVYQLSYVQGWYGVCPLDISARLT